MGTIKDFTLLTDGLDADSLLWTQRDASGGTTYDQDRAVKPAQLGINIFNVKAYGAVGDGSTDDTTAIQACFNAAGDNAVYIPAGDYVVTDTIFITGGSKTTDSGAFNSIHLSGAGSGYSSGEQITVIDGTAINDQPIFVIQRGRRVIVENLMVLGGNVAGSALSEPSSDIADYLTGTFRDDRYSPQCAFAIDPTLGDTPPSGGGYSGFTYHNTTGFSSGVLFRNLVIRDNVVGVMVGSLDDAVQQDQIVYEDVKIHGAVHCISVGQSQARANIVRGGDYSYCFTCFEGTVHGAQQGVPPQLYSPQIGNCYAMVRFDNSFGTPLNAYGIHAEQIKTIGRWGNGSQSTRYAAIFQACEFKFDEPSATELAAPYVFQSHSPTKFIGCNIANADDRFTYAINFVGSEQAEVQFDNCTFQGGEGTDAMPFIGRNRDLYHPARFNNCWVDPEAGTSNILTDDYNRSSVTTDRLNVECNFRSIQHKQNYYVAKYWDDNEYEAITSNTYSVGASTISFTASEDGVLQVGDVINWRMDDPLSGAADLDYPALVVTSVTPDAGDDDIVCDMLWEADWYQTDYAPSSVKVQKRQFALDPDVTISGTLTSGNAVIASMTNEALLEVGDWLSSDIAGIPNNTRIISIGSGTATLNQNANGSGAVDLYDIELIDLTP